MLKNVKKYLKHKSKYYLLGVCIDQNIEQYQLLIVSYNDGNLEIDERHTSNTLDNLLKEHLTNDYGVIAYLEGADIINKKTIYETGYRSNILFKANLNDFFFYEYKQQQNIFVSIVRKEYVNQLTKTLNDLNRTIIHLSFGPFVLANAIPLLGDKKELHSFNNGLKIENNEITDFYKQEKTVEYKIKEDTFNQKELPLLGAFLDYKFPLESINFENNFLSKNREEHKYKGLLRSYGIIGVTLLLFSILASHNLLSSYLTELEAKKSLHLQYNQKVNELNDSEKELKLKESILESSSVFNKNYATKYYADIGNSSPKEVSLQNINFIPIQKKIRTKAKVLFTSKAIIIEGESNNDNAFNNWIEDLQNILWIKKIDILDYKQVKKNNNTFKLNIKF